MKTRLVMDKITIEIPGNGTGPIADYVESRLNVAFNAYNSACEGLKAEYPAKVPPLGSIEREWFRFADWAGVYKVVTEFLVSHKEGRKTFPNVAGYIERVRE